MKRYYYNNWLAKVLLFFSTCHTIAVAWFVLSKRSEAGTDQTDRNHETIHALQWTEVTMTAGAIIFAAVLAFGISPWWMLLSPVVYYVWYLLEWLCKLPSGNAYRSIGFEQEAYANDSDPDYVENRHLFCGWMKRVLTTVKRKTTTKT